MKARPPLAQQASLFPAGAGAPAQLPVLGSQGDIRYHASPARGILNTPATTGMTYWSINPYVGCAFGCAYCYARYTHRYAMERASALPQASRDLRWDAATMPPWLAFERRVLVKENAAEALRKALHRHGAKLHGETIVLGTATDPYQPAERRYRITRALLEVLAGWPGPRLVIITKSPLVTRDIEVLRRFAARDRVTVYVTIITLDAGLARRIEMRAPPPSARLDAVARLARAGIPAGVNIMPVLPGITDRPADLERLVKAVAEAGAVSIGACALRLQATARERYLPFIEREFPGLAGRYRKSYAGSSQVSLEYRKALSARVRGYCEKYGVRQSRQHDERVSGGMEKDAPPGASRRAEQLRMEL